jgi:ABC-type antimicrobial peptide transport system permease subunit
LFWESTDYRFIQEQAPDCQYVVPELGNPAAIRSSYNAATITVTGSLPPFAAIRSIPVGEGRFYTWEDEALARRVAFLGTDVKTQLFGTRPAVGETVLVGSFPYTVIGVMQRKEQGSSYDGFDVNKIFVPFSAILRDLPNKPPATPHSVDRLLVSPKSYARHEACKGFVRTTARCAMKSPPRGGGSVPRTAQSGGAWSSWETVTIGGLRFSVVGVLEEKMQESSYFSPDDESAFIPYTTAGELWDTRYASVLVFTPFSSELESRAMDQVRGTMARRQKLVPWSSSGKLTRTHRGKATSG